MGAVSQELTERAKVLISERRYQEAVRACRRALLSKPGLIEVRLLLAEALLALERYDEVRVEMVAVARKAKDRAEPHRILGEAYLRDGRPAQAVEALQKALSLDPSDEAAKELLAEAEDESGPASKTIDRWFAHEAERTVETNSPGWTEEKTPIPPPRGRAARPGLAPRPGSDTPGSDTPGTPGSDTVVARPPRRLRSSKKTLQGLPQDYGLPSAKKAASRIPAPPRAGALPRRPLPAKMPPPSAPPPKTKAPWAPGPSQPSEWDDPTNLERPSAKAAHTLDRSAPPHDLDSGEVAALKSEEISVVELLPESTQVLPPHLRGEPPADDSIDDDSPTQAYSAANVDFIDETTAPMKPVADPARPVADPPTHTPPTFDVPPRPAPYPALTPTESPVPAPAPPAGAPATRSAGARRWILPALLSGFAALVFLGLGLFGTLRWMESAEKQEIRDAAATAGDSGARTDLQRVVDRIGETDDEELRALEARLLATLTFEHGEDHASEVEALISDAASEDESRADAAIATALLALAHGDPRTAARTLRGLRARGEQVPEAFRARAYAMAALGDWEEAEAGAGRAVDVRPSAPRHLALHALMRHRRGETAGALTLLAGIPDRDRYPAVRVARARILAESGGDSQQALADAGAVVDELSAVATPFEIAWSHLIRASLGTEEALEEAHLAAEHRPPLDEAFGMRLVEVLLRAGEAAEADEHLENLPEFVVDTSGRALLTAEVALAVGDLDRAETSVSAAGVGVRQDVLRARIFEARGEPEQARPLYERSMSAPGSEGRTAVIRLAAIEMAAGNAERTVTLLEPRQADAVDDLELIPLLARAYLAVDRIEDTARILDQALERRPDAPALLAVQGTLQLVRGEPAEALTALRAAAEALPHDASIQADLGRAAYLTGDADAARAAFEATLAIDETSARALVGLGRIAFEAGELDEAEARAEAASRAGGEALEVAHLSAELLVARGAGAGGVDTVRAFTRAHRRDAALWTALGHLQAQAEQDRDAAQSYGRALRIIENHPDALLGQALVLTRRGDLPGARRSIEEAVAAAEQSGDEAVYAARVAVALGRIELEEGHQNEAVAKANEALEADANLASAHHLLGNVAIVRNQAATAVEHLQRAVTGHTPPPEAFGQLVPRLPAGEEACSLAQRYLEAAPEGYDARDVRRIASRCP